MHETELVDRLRKGDEGAFRLFVDTYQVSLLNCCYRVIGDRLTAEDLTQEVFIEVFRSIRHFRSESKLSTWVYRIAMSKALDHLKSLRRKKRFAILKSLTSAGPEPDAAIPSDLPTPHQALEQEERRRVLLRAIDSLPDNQRAAFTLSKHDELSYREIAEILDTTVPAVESLIFRARERLKTRLTRYYRGRL